MSNVQRSGGNRPTRKQREQRAFRLVVATGVLGTLTVVDFVLVLVAGASFGIFLLLLILTGVAGFVAKKSVS